MDKALADAMTPVLTTFAADGYEGIYEVDGDTFRLEIVAGDGACEDCLSPKSIVSRIVVSALANAGFDYEVELTYPADSRGAES